MDSLLGDSSKAKRVLKWEPKITFKQLVKEMVLNDIEEIGNTLKDGKIRIKETAE